MEIQLRGKKALIILLLFMSMWAIQWWRMRQTLKPQAIEALRPWIVAHYSREALSNVNVSSLKDMTPQQRQTFSEEILAAQNVEIKSIQARGIGSKITARVEIRVDGQIPPDGKAIRYYRMHYAPIIGWTFEQETNAWAYRLGL